jgi:phage terminase large subunit GpA-like protein
MIRDARDRREVRGVQELAAAPAVSRRPAADRRRQHRLASFRRVSRRVAAARRGRRLRADRRATKAIAIALAIRRTEYYWNRKIVAGSTPKLAGASRIEQLFAEGDQRRYYVPCTQCGHMDYLTFYRETTDEDGTPVGHFMKWDRPDGSDGALRLQQLRRRDRGEGQARDARARRMARARTVHRSREFSHLGGVQLFAERDLVAARRRIPRGARAGVEQLKTYVNTVLGETWKESGDAPAWERLYERRKPTTSGPARRRAVPDRRRRRPDRPPGLRGRRLGPR